jgi:hypothetical protein
MHLGGADNDTVLVLHLIAYHEQSGIQLCQANGGNFI